MRVRGAHRPHFPQRDVNAALGQLPGRFAARQAAADDCYANCYVPQILFYFRPSPFTSR